MHFSLSLRFAMLLLAPMSALLVLFFAYPLALIAWQSVYDGGFTLKGYAALTTSRLFSLVLWNTFEISITATCVSLVLGYAIAMHLARQPPRRRTLYMIIVMLPFWTSILVKSYAFTITLGEKGLVNQILRGLTAGAFSIEMMFNRAGVVIGMINYLLPFMILPILASLLAQDQALHRVAELMGAGPVRIFFRITLPLSLPGVLAGVLMNLALAVGMYITPALLGGRRDMMMANLVDFYTRQTLDWNVASAISIILLAISAILAGLLMRVRGAGQFA
jgi:putative spermidine/putrescine transport system permease protein